MVKPKLENLFLAIFFLFIIFTNYVAARTSILSRTLTPLARHSLARQSMARSPLARSPMARSHMVREWEWDVFWATGGAERTPRTRATDAQKNFASSSGGFGPGRMLSVESDRTVFERRLLQFQPRVLSWAKTQFSSSFLDRRHRLTEKGFFKMTFLEEKALPDLKGKRACKNFLKIRCTEPSCDLWHPPVSLNHKSESRCKYGDYRQFRHTEAGGQPRQKSKKSGGKGSVAVFKETIQLGCVSKQKTSSHAHFSQSCQSSWCSALYSPLLALVNTFSHVHTCVWLKTETCCLCALAPKSLILTPCCTDFFGTFPTSHHSARHHRQRHFFNSADWNQNTPLCMSATGDAVWLSGRLFSHRI